MKKTVQRVSKSIQFGDAVIAKLDALAKELGMTRSRNGVEEGDVSKIVRRLSEFGLDNIDQFKTWTVGKSNGGKAVKKHVKEKVAA